MACLYEASPMIHTSLSPNSTPKDLFLSLAQLLLPWKWLSWQNGKNLHQLEEKLKTYLGVKYVILFDSGRSSLYAALKALDLTKNDEILLQAFTCIVVPNAIIFNHAKRVYVDIDDNYNLDPADLEKKITPNSKAVIIQNTFGKPANYDEILKIANQHNLKIIEDCAHSLGADYKNKKLGTLGDIAIFSFGRDKVISAIYGGAASTNDDHLAKKLRAFQTSLPWPSKKTIFSHLFHPIIFSLAIPFYDFFKLGRIIIRSAQKLNLISKVLQPAEKRAKLPIGQPAKFPNALAKIALHQLSLVDKFNNHRQKIAAYYREKLKNTDYQFPAEEKSEKNIYLRFPVRHKNRSEILRLAKKQGIYLGDWYDTVVAPHDVHEPATAYHDGDCKKAEPAAKAVFNLPTHHKITLKKAAKIIEFLKTLS